MTSIPRVSVLVTYSLIQYQFFVIIRHNGDFMICVSQQIWFGR